MPKPLDFSDLEEKYRIPEVDPHEGVVVVDGLPVVPAAKVPKLENVLKKIFGGQVSDVFLCCDQEGGTKGFAFLKFPSKELADVAVAQGNNYKLDKSHTLLVNHLKDISDMEAVDSEYKDPEIEPFVEREFLKHWLLDPRDQFAVMKQDLVSVYANNQDEEPLMIHERNNWSEMYIAWSPKGTYFATFHKQGIAVWGGESFTRMARLAHQNVKLIDFSPNEEYLTTFSVEGFSSGDATHNINIWRVADGKKLRSFPFDSQLIQESSQVPWPHFKWSSDDKYVARIRKNGIYIYETPTMNLLDKKAITAESIEDFSWSPTDPIVAYWIPESGNIPARIILMKIPTREVIKTKNLFNAQSVKMYWHPNGDYLLIHVVQVKKKQLSNHFEIFRLREKGIPIDVMDRKGQEAVTQITWEPFGKKFTTISLESQKITTTFYEMITEKDKNLDKIDTGVEIALVHSMESRGINTVSWSPQGRFCVLGGIRAYSGTLEFWDTQPMTLMSSSEHEMCTGLEWDPSGRFVTSLVSFWNVQSDTGYIIWSFTGNLLLKKLLPVMKQFIWRPRPPSLLSPEQKQEIRKNIKKYSVAFDKIDAARRNRADQDVIDKRNALWEQWIAFRNAAAIKYTDLKQERIAIYGFDPDSQRESDEDIEEIVEQVIEEKVEKVQ